MNPTALLETLLTHYSPTGNEMSAVQFLHQAMEQLGYTAHIDAAGNVIGTRGSGPREILLLGHIDTVPGMIEVRSEGDLLFGRGAVDAKGALACFTAAVAQITP
ncbi:MAG: M20/M25/M40 family metallo-hydrolase, partial [Chloroflexota bacterium]